MEQRRTSTVSPSNSMLVSYGRRQLVPFYRHRLPPGWGVEEVPRQNVSYSDKYYYEPGTGRKFRSMKEVERYLNGEGYPCRSKRNVSGYRGRLLSGVKNSKCRRMIVSDGKLLRLDDNELRKNCLAIVPSRKAVRMAPDILPDGWIIEEVPRRYDDNWIDKYYYEPGTGLKFRSLISVGRYLAESEENVPLSKVLEEIKENKPLSKLFKLENHTKKSIPRKKNILGANMQASSFTSPPMKVNWVLASPQGDVWYPFISETLVPESVKQQWSDRFMIFMNDGSNNFQSS